MNQLYFSTFKSILVFSVLISISTAIKSKETLAKQNLNQKQLYIESDSMFYDDNKRMSIYRGNVIAKQTARKLYGDKIIVSYNPDKSIKTIEVFGNPARYNQSKTDKQKKLKASALYIKYIKKTQLLELKKEVHFNQDGLKSSSDKLIYKIDTGEINAKSNSNSRVEVILN